MARTLAEIDVDIAAVRTALAAARTAVSLGAEGQTVSRSYADLRGELKDLLEERAAAELADAGKARIQRVSTMRGW